MPQSLANVLVHIVFSTKLRQPLLRDRAVRDTMIGYMIGTLRQLECPALEIGMVDDHVHVLCHLHRTVSIAALVEKLKVGASRRIKEEGPAYADFHWQKGYGVFSVSQSNVDQVRAYVANQEDHHRQRSFQEEFRLLLERHALAWDEQYVWD